MWKAFVNILKVKELRSRLLFTGMIIVLVRFACNIPCPGINVKALSDYMSTIQASGGAGSDLMKMLALFSGGAFEQFAIGALGIMPYITASIVVQLLTPVLPALEKLKREGESGHQKINQYTRYLTIIVCLFQGFGIAAAVINPSKIFSTAPATPLFIGNPTFFMFMSVVVLTATTMMFMWLGEQITERGISNGVSLIIMINIIARMPQACIELYRLVSGGEIKSIHVLLLVLLFFVVTSATIILSQGYRRVPIQMVRKTVGSQMTGGSTFMPLKVNFAGVMPIIFAGAVMMIPGALFSYLGWSGAASVFNREGGWYMVIEALLILVFSFFWVANQFNPLQVADNLKKEGSYIPGISPGQPTADFLDSTMTKVTLGGALFLMVLAIFPMFLYSNFHLPFNITQFFGGTSLLIMVGVTLDTMRQLESHLTTRHYDGFLKSGRLRGRSGN